MHECFEKEQTLQFFNQKNQQRQNVKWHIIWNISDVTYLQAWEDLQPTLNAFMILFGGLTARQINIAE